MPQTTGQCILYYTHIQDYLRHEEALLHLRTIASLVKPIMRARGWKIGVLSELHPEKPEILGLNFAKGAKVFVRLRDPKDSSQFLSIEMMTDSLLHELCHNKYESHDDKFYKLWNKLRAEMDGMLTRGYAGEGSLDVSRPAGNTPFHGKDNAGPSSGFPDDLVGPTFLDIFRLTVSRRVKIPDNDCLQKSNRDMPMATRKWTGSSIIRTRASKDDVRDAADSQALWNVVRQDLRKNRTSRRGGGGGDFFPPRDPSTASRDPFTAPQRVTFATPQDSHAALRDPSPTTRDRSQIPRGPSPASTQEPSTASRGPSTAPRNISAASRGPYAALQDTFPTPRGRSQIPRNTPPASRDPSTAPRTSSTASRDTYTALQDSFLTPRDRSQIPHDPPYGFRTPLLSFKDYFLYKLAESSPSLAGYLRDITKSFPSFGRYLRDPTRSLPSPTGYLQDLKGFLHGGARFFSRPVGNLDGFGELLRWIQF